MDSLPFTVIGGYLGAGKTTLLNHLLTNAAGLRLAVLVNDFGSVNIDVDLIRSHDGDTINLANGCMCCTLVNGFASAIGRIRDRSGDFDHIIVEASGVADPGKIAQYGQMYLLPLDAILVVADAEQIRTQAKNKYVGDTVVRQFSQADLIVVNKTDLVTTEELTNLRTWLANLAPGTPMIETVQSEVPMEVLLRAHRVHAPTTSESDEYHQANYAHNTESDESHQADHPQAFETWTVQRSRPLNRQVINRFALGLGEDIYRAKGFVCLHEDPQRRYVYHQVGARWSLEPGTAWGNDQPQTLLVVIGRRGGTSAETLDGLLEGDSLQLKY